MANIAKLMGTPIGNFTKVMGVSKSTLNKIMGLDVASLPPVSGYVLWVDASGLATGTGINAATTPVVNLGSQGGSFNVGTYDVAASAIGGKTALKFDGSAQHLKSTDAYSNSGTAMTLFIVSQRIGGTSAWKGMFSTVYPGTSDNTDGRGFGFYQDDQSPQNLTVARAYASYVPIDHPGNGVDFISTVKFNGTNVTGYLKNGGSFSAGPSANTDTFGCTQTVIGARQQPNPVTFANIYVGEVLIYNTALNDTDREAVENYLASKWGI